LIDDRLRTSSMLIADARRLRSSFSTFRVRRPQHTAMLPRFYFQ
jgi:hypothetical protein